MTTHIPVLLETIISQLPSQKGTIVDATFGGGGYTQAFLDAGFKVVAFDKDAEAIARGHERFDNVELIHSSYANLADNLLLNNIISPKAIVFDLGVSSFQLDNSKRGFSWKDELAPLDMRMDDSKTFTAADILNSYEYVQLKKILYNYGDEPLAGKIAGEVVRRREKERFVVSGDFKKVLERVYGYKLNGSKIARNFQALRIEVNDELGELEQGLAQAAACLAVGGRLLVVSFHSLEDRIVKTFLRKMAVGCTCPPKFPKCVCGNTPTLKLLNKKPILPSVAEVEINIRARSAKLRVGEKL